MKLSTIVEFGLTTAMVAPGTMVKTLGGGDQPKAKKQRGKKPKFNENGMTEIKPKLK
jgi:hypothetical protein